MQHAPERADVGRFLISLDFELYWGMHDVRSIESYGTAIRGARTAVPATLDLFERFGIRATWATVGMLFFEDMREAKAHLPEVRPRYEHDRLNSYRLLDLLEARAEDHDLLFAKGLVQKIKEREGQELATHTFSHYYCWDDGDDAAAFRADLAAVIERAAAHDTEIKSIVFPRNQVKPAYLRICREFGLSSFRDRPSSRLFDRSSSRWQSRLTRAGRVADSFLPIDASHLRPPHQADGEPVNIVGSRFLRADATDVPGLRFLHLNRIKKEMNEAAAKGGLYHLWWHPHNFGIDTERRLALLEEILAHYRTLHAEYGMISSTMQETAEAFMAENTIDRSESIDPAESMSKSQPAAARRAGLEPLQGPAPSC